MQDTHQSQNGSGNRPQASCFGLRGSRGLIARRPDAFSQRFARRTPRPSRGLKRAAFTLTELLIVIAIIAVLASLVTAAAVNALRAGKRTQILLEMKQMDGAMADFKNDYGAYPPNGFNPNPSSNPATGTPARLVQSDFERMFKKAFPRHNEPIGLIHALCGQNPSGPNLPNGMNAEEALYFWLGGFSDDPQYPISGPGGPSYVWKDNNRSGDVTNEILENRKRRYEFDLGRLYPRNDDGSFAGRTLSQPYPDPQDPSVTRQINFWEYTPKGSKKPFVYFDVSRYKPVQYDPAGEMPQPGDDEIANVFAIKQLRQGVSTPSNMNDFVFVNSGKCQILHAGLDDAWGTRNFGGSFTNLSNPPASYILYPSGPFVGDAADTLANFADGPLADSQENK